MKEYIGNDNITLNFINKELNQSACIEISHLPSFKDLLDEDIDDCWFFNRLFVSPKIRNQGIATKLMNRLIEILDEKNICLVNTVNSYGDLDQDQLITFYKKFGFRDGCSDSNYKGLLVYIPNKK